MLFEGLPHASHGTVKLESGDVTHAYSAMSKLPEERLSGPSPNRTFGGTSRMFTSMPIALRFSLYTCAESTRRRFVPVVVWVITALVPPQAMMPSPPSRQPCDVRSCRALLKL